jgi:glycosyltransferase involved in cell wall biosynthesis
VSIGVPIYNGARYVGRALDSLLAQTFTDFELIITDNASTDGTEAICRDYAQRDPRIQYHRADANQGVVHNFNWCVELARGEYFHWHAADDMVAPTMLEKCVAVLDADPSVILAFARTTLIDEQDRPIRQNDYDVDADHGAAHARFGNVINLDHRRHCAQEVYGVMRTDGLRRTPLYQPVVRTDSILLARLALLGRFRAVEEPLFLNRQHGERSVQLIPGQRAKTRSRLSRWVGVGPIPPADFWNPALAGKIVFPEWQILREYVRSIPLAPRSPIERLRCWLTLGRFTLKHTPKLIRDLLIGAEHLVLGQPGSERRTAHALRQHGIT